MIVAHGDVDRECPAGGPLLDSDASNGDFDTLNEEVFITWNLSADRCFRYDIEQMMSGDHAE